MTPIAQQAAREEFMKYVAGDGLKPQFDGMTAWEIAGKIVDAARDVDIGEMLEDMSQDELDGHDCKGEKCEVCIELRPEYVI